MPDTSFSRDSAVFDPQRITRPDRTLLGYYLVVSLATGPFSPIAFLPLFFKYHTLRYRFDDQGISMKWGLLFRREIYLTYRRIQDIHLTANILQRWFGLATVAIQTASGSAGPEMSIEGIVEFAQLRDHLYAQMRGARGLDDPETDRSSADVAADGSDEALSLLHEIRDLLRSRIAQSETES